MSFDVGGEIDAVLFDMGGVLLDLLNSRGLPFGDYDLSGRAALLELLHTTGADQTVDDRTLDKLLFAPWQDGYRRRYELGREEPIAPHLERLRQETAARASSSQLLEAWAGAYSNALTMIDEPAKTLRTLVSQGRRLALCSNVPLPGWLYRRALDRFGLAEPFEVLLFSSDRGARKPGPGLLFDALRALDVPPQRALMVGDRPSSDVAAGRAAGTWTLWLRRPEAGDEEREGPRPDAVIERLDELVPLLGKAT